MTDGSNDDILEHDPAEDGVSVAKGRSEANIAAGTTLRSAGSGTISRKQCRLAKFCRCGGVQGTGQDERFALMVSHGYLAIPLASPGIILHTNGG